MMTSSHDQYTPLTNSSANQSPAQPAPPPQRHADWISYAVAVTQQAASVSAGFSSDSES